MRKILIFSLFHVSYFIFHTSAAYAEEFSLGIYPPLTVIEQTDPEISELPIELENFSESPVSLTISYREFTASSEENGQVNFVPDNPRFLAFRKQLVLLDANEPINQVDMAGKEKKLFKLRATNPETLAGDYYFSTIFTNTQDQLTDSSEPATTTSLHSGIAANVLLSVGQRQKPNIKIETFTTSEFRENGPTAFNVRITNETNQLVEAKGEILIRNMFGQLVAKIPLEPSYVLSKTTRRLTTVSSATALWPERFILGSYKATVNVTQGDGNKLSEASTQFYAFPVTNFLKLSGIALASFFIIKRIKYHLKQGK